MRIELDEPRGGSAITVFRDEKLGIDVSLGSMSILRLNKLDLEILGGDKFGEKVKACVGLDTLWSADKLLALGYRFITRHFRRHPEAFKEFINDCIRRAFREGTDQAQLRMRRALGFHYDEQGCYDASPENAGPEMV